MRLPRDVRVLVAAGFLVAMGYGIVAPDLPAFAQGLGAGVATVSAVVSAFALVRVLFAPLSGLLIRRGALPVFCAGLLVVGVSSAACAFATDVVQLLLLRATGGVGSTMFTVAADALIIRTAPPAQRGQASAAWASGFLLGTVAGPVAGGALATLSTRVPFLVYAGALVLAATLAGAALRGKVGPPPDAACVRRRVGFGAALRHRAFRAALASNFVNGWTVYGVRLTLVPLFVAQALAGSVLWAGVVLTAFAVGTAVALPAGGRLADSRGRRLPVLVGSVLVAIATLGLGLGSTPVPLLCASLLSGVGTGLMDPPVAATVADVIAGGGRAADGGPALAAFQMVGDAGAVVGPVLAGLAAERGGYPAAFVLTAAVVALSCVGWVGARETRPGRR